MGDPRGPARLGHRGHEPAAEGILDISRRPFADRLGEHRGANMTAMVSEYLLEAVLGSDAYVIRAEPTGMPSGVTLTLGRAGRRTPTSLHPGPELDPPYPPRGRRSLRGNRPSGGRCRPQPRQGASRGTCKGDQIGKHALGTLAARHAAGDQGHLGLVVLRCPSGTVRYCPVKVRRDAEPFERRCRRCCWEQPRQRPQARRGGLLATAQANRPTRTGQVFWASRRTRRSHPPRSPYTPSPLRPRRPDVVVRGTMSTTLRQAKDATPTPAKTFTVGVRK